MSMNSQSSLFKNGKVLTRRDIDGSDAGSVGLDLEKYEMKVTNVRDSLNIKSISLDKQGFELFPSKIKVCSFLGNLTLNTIKRSCS